MPTAAGRVLLFFGVLGAAARGDGVRLLDRVNLAVENVKVEKRAVGGLNDTSSASW
jgi:hypothetical protein